MTKTTTEDRDGFRLETVDHTVDEPGFPIVHEFIGCNLGQPDECRVQWRQLGDDEWNDLTTDTEFFGKVEFRHIIDFECSIDELDTTITDLTVRADPPCSHTFPVETTEDVAEAMLADCEHCFVERISVPFSVDKMPAMDVCMVCGDVLNRYFNTIPVADCAGGQPSFEAAIAETWPINWDWSDFLLTSANHNWRRMNIDSYIMMHCKLCGMFVPEEKFGKYEHSDCE